MLLSLVKKDFILAKRHLLIMLLFAIGAPVFVSYQMQLNSAGFLEFYIPAFFTVYLLFNTVSLEEDKYRGATLLCATPYTRKLLVQAKYIFIFTVFAACYLIYSVTALLVPVGMPPLSPAVLAWTLLLMTVFFGILVPVQYQFGYQNTRYIFAFLVFIAPFTIPFLIMRLQHTGPLSLSISPVLLVLLPVMLSLLTVGISMLIAVKIYAHKDL